jgi:glycosyltransferase involved in cell wall biosynthesis
MKPLVSVVIPSFNHERFLEEAIRSVLRQTHENVEVIVVDDGSTDNSLDVAHAIHDPRVRIYAQENQGAHAAINRGLALARGTWLAILNSDDVFAPSRLEKLLCSFEAEPRPALACSHIEIVDSTGKVLGVKHGFHDLLPRSIAHPMDTFAALDDPVLNLLGSNYLATTSNMLFPAALIEQIGTFRAFRYTHDWDFALRAAVCGDIAIVDEPLVRYRVHTRNTIRENERRMVVEINITLAANLARVLRRRRDHMPLPELAHRLVHSLDLYGCERMFVVLLAMFAACDDEDDLIRQTADPCTSFGQSLLAMTVARRTPGPVSRGPGLKRWFNRIRTLLRSAS